MIHQTLFKQYLTLYKAEFSAKLWPNEKYKWEAVKWFQEHWDINASDFPSMLKLSLSKTMNLLASVNHFPAGVIVYFAEHNPEAVRGMFLELYDETRDLWERIDSFKKRAKELQEQDKNSGNQHFQYEDAITTYLWLRYPDKYYVYKYSIAKETAEKLQSSYKIKQGRYAANIRNFNALYNEIHDEMIQDEGTIALLRNCLTDTCYSDPQLRTMTFDFCFFVGKYLGGMTKAEDSGQSSAGSPSAPAKQEKPSDTPVLPGRKPTFWKISHGPDFISGKEAELFEQRNVIVADRMTKAKGLSQIAQGQNFAEHMHTGDYFYVCRGNSIRLLGRLESEEIRENPEKKAPWLERSYARVRTSVDQSPYTGLQKWWTPNDNSTCIRVPETELELFEKQILTPYFQLTLQELAGEQNEVKEKMSYGKTDFLNDVFMTQAQYDRLAAVLKRKKNLILQGAPGVGKTFAAKRLAYSIMGERDDDRIAFIQFHQNYSYEDFVMGYKPSGDGFELKYGIFYQFCQKAASHPDQDYFFIIDEINRGNMSKIFGELLMLIESGYRGQEAVLAYNGLPFSVPERLHLIGMMNTADRSLAMIDYALRRRFSFFDMEPGFESEGFAKYQKQLENEIFDVLIDRIRELNREIAQDRTLGKGFCIGHSYFCNAEACTEEWMRDIVDFDILPMLREYWFDDADRVQRWENILHGVFAQ